MNTRNFDPLKSLPYEVCVRVMQFYARDQPEGVLPLLRVSMLWQESLIQAPELWNTIYFDGGHDEKCRAECFFYMSKTLPIEVVLDRNVGSMETILKYKDRIKTLVFRTKSRNGLTGVYIGEIPTLSQISQCIYPILTHIHIESPPQEIFLIPPDLIEVCPALIGIYGGFVGQEIASRLSSNTTALGVLGYGKLRRGIGDQLDVLRIRWIPGGSEPTGRFEYFTVPSTRLRQFELIVPPRTYRGQTEGGLQHFYLFQAFTSTVHYELHTITLTINCGDIFRFIPSLSACRALRDLRLYLDYESPTLWGHTLDLPADIGHIRKFTLSTATAQPKLFSNIIAAANNLRGTIRWFFRNAAFQDLEELRLNYFVRGPIISTDSTILDLLVTAKNLKELHLTGLTLRPSSKDVKKATLNRLHTLVIDREADLEYLDLPNLSCLECSNRVRGGWHIPIPGILRSFKGDSSTVYRWNEYMVTNHADREPFPQLVTLELTETFNNLEPPSGVLKFQPTRQSIHRSILTPLNLSNLASISFVDLLYIGQSGTATLNRFMLDVLLSPDLCPRLQTIRAVRYPNWALAAAMSYRRNSLKSVAKIGSLWLPGCPQTVALRAITRALDGAGEAPRQIITAAEPDGGHGS